MMEGGRTGQRGTGCIRAGAFQRALWSLGAACGLAGCGAPAAPQPPTLNLPQPVANLEISRFGDTVHATFAVPQKTTDKLPIRGQMTAQLCRGVEDASCQPSVSLELSAAEKTVAMDDTLPAALSQGAPRLLVYRVVVRNAGGKFAAPSTPAYTTAGASPLPVAAFTVTPRRDGILLGWRPPTSPDAAGWIRVDRVRTAGPPPPAASQHGDQREPEEPAEQSLRVPDGDLAHPLALDTNVRTGRSYRYTAQRVDQLTLSGHAVEVASAPTPPVHITYRDIFPPRTPAGLISAVDTPGRAIDLSWTPDAGAGLAGYIVYRRTVAPAGSSSPDRISPAKALATPAWRDTTVVAGERYAYSVSAIDTAGNESARSAEVEDGLIAAASHP